MSVPGLAVYIMSRLCADIIATETNIKWVGEGDVASTGVVLGPTSHFHKVADACYGPRRVFLDDGFVDAICCIPTKGRIQKGGQWGLKGLLGNQEQGHGLLKVLQELRIHRCPGSELLLSKLQSIAHVSTRYATIPDQLDKLKS